MDTLIRLIKRRRSVRRFSTTSVSEEHLWPILDAMRWAPSAGNVQPLRVYVVRNVQVRQQLGSAALGQRFIAEAPVVLVTVAELAEAARAYGDRGVELYSLQDTAAATQNALLAAEATGLAACWVGAFDENRVSKALGLPGTERPVALVPVGFAAESPVAPPRRSLDEIIRHVV